MKIRIKVKTIILVFVLALTVEFILPEVFLYTVEKMEDDENKVKLYGAYLKMPLATSKDKALYNMAKALVPYIDTYDIFMSASWGSRENLLTKEYIEKAVECYEKILNQYEDSPYYADAYKNLIDIYIGKADIKKVMELIDWGKKSSDEKIVYVSQLYTAFNHMINREYDEAMEIVEKYILEGVEDRRLYALKESIYFLQGKYDLAEKAFEETRNKAYIHDSSENLFGSMKEVFNSHWIDSFIKSYTGDNVIKGRVTFNRKGIPYAQIYIHRKSQYGTYSPNGEIYIAITDFNGNFESVGIKEGEYEIGVGISKPLAYNLVFKEKNEETLEVNGDTTYDFEFTDPMEILSPKGEFVINDNRFNIKWEKVEGADYYRIFAVAFEEPFNMGGISMTYAIPDEKGEYDIKDNETTIDIDVANSYPTSVFFLDDDSGESIISPNGILGTFYPNVKVPIIVKAFDAEGNLLSSTLPLMSNYEDMTVAIVKNRDLSEGENFIVNKEYEKAIDYYKGILKGDDKNIEALTYLYRLYAEGWKKGTDNLDKAKEYSERLYDITHDDNVFIRINAILERRKQGIK